MATVQRAKGAVQVTAADAAAGRAKGAVQVKGDPSISAALTNNFSGSVAENAMTGKTLTVTLTGDTWIP